MSMKICKECGNQVSKSAKSCPKCGKKLKRTSTIAIVFIIFAICLVIAIESSMSRVDISDVSQTYYIGDTIDLGDFSVKLESCMTKNKGDIIDDYSVVNDQQWIAVFLTYTNKTQEEKIIPRNVRLINSSGEQLEQPVIYYNVWNGEHLDEANLMSGGSKTGFLSFINTNIDNLEDLKFQISTSSSFNKNSTINFKLINKPIE